MSYNTRPTLGLLLATTMVVAALLATPAALACDLDGIASMSMNGTVATINGGQATASNLRYWAKFDLLAAAPGDRLQYGENLANVSLSIPKESVALPFKWSFGDGASALGHAVSHQYTHIGWYKVTVQYYWPARRQWLQFDSAEQQIVPSGDLFWTNFGYYAGQVFQTVLRIAIWTALLVVIALMVLERIRPRIWRRVRGK